MQTKIHLDESDRIHGTGTAIVIASEDIDQIAIFVPDDPEQALRFCSQIVDAVENIRHRAFSQIHAGS